MNPFFKILCKEALNLGIGHDQPDSINLFVHSIINEYSLLLILSRVIMMLDKLNEAIDVGTSSGASYIEIRHLDVERTTINLLDGKGKAVPE